MDGIMFDAIHSYYDLNLVLSKVDIPPATAKSNFVDIPGGDGSVDLSEALGEVKYKDRECNFTFTVFPEEDFEEKKRKISNLLNGKRYKITVNKDPNYYWVGRCFVNKYKSSRLNHTIVVGAKVSPYKLKHSETVVVVPAGEKVERVLNNSRKRAIPRIVTSAAAVIAFKNVVIETNAPGEYRFLEIELQEGENLVTVTSDSDVIFFYQEGDL